MKRPLLLKFLTIAGLMLLLLIPVSMINGSVNERQSYSQTVLQDIARSSSYSQTLVGPVMVIPYTKKETTWRYKDDEPRELVEQQIEGKLYFLPKTLKLDVSMETELRHRGIYSARLYHANSNFNGDFDIPENYGIKDSLNDYTFATPYVAVGVSDIRGIKHSPTIQLGEKNYPLSPGTQVSMWSEGVHTEVEAWNKAKPIKLKFSLNLALQGTESFSVIPIGQDTHVKIHSDWAHPSFFGQFLPTERDISEDGFSAQWQTSYFSTNFLEHFNRCVKRKNCDPDSFHAKRFGVSLIDPVDFYVKSDRATKYALLFIGLTFAGFFLFEVLKRIQVHPIQYGLVGLSLALFYLLLLSLSEHLGFELAYTLSSLACVSLITYYVKSVLQSLQRALGFGSALAVLYALLYGLLQAEDYSLLMGSSLLFLLLGVFMVLTRDVDWYQFKPIENQETTHEVM